MNYDDFFLSTDTPNKEEVIALGQTTPDPERFEKAMASDTVLCANLNRVMRAISNVKG